MDGKKRLRVRRKGNVTTISVGDGRKFGAFEHPELIAAWDILAYTVEEGGMFYRYSGCLPEHWAACFLTDGRVYDRVLAGLGVSAWRHTDPAQVASSIAF